MTDAFMDIDKMCDEQSPAQWLPECWVHTLDYLSSFDFMQIRLLDKSTHSIVQSHIQSILWLHNTPFPSFLSQCHHLLSLTITSKEPGLLNDINVNYLPPSLLSLVAPHQSLLSNESMALLPRTLTHLEFKSKLSKSKAIHDLPRTLVYLECRITRHFKTNMIDAPSIYPSLRKLPPSLETLILNNPFFSDSDLPTIYIKHLPRSLTHLCFSHEKHVSLHRIQQLPSQLKYLEICKNESLSDAMIQHLPRTLTHLDLDHNETITYMGLSHLPIGLKYLSLNHNRNITDVGIHHLPATLTYFDVNSVENFTNACIGLLPRCLTHLDMGWSRQLTFMCFKDLPPQLLYLNLQLMQPLTEIRDLTLLPQTLQQFRLPTKRILLKPLIQHVPRSLTHLHLSKKGLRVKDMRHLPPHLTYLSIYDKRLTDEHLFHLPSSLKTLILERDTQLTDLGLMHLPHGLTTLEIPMNRNLTDRVIEYLPPTLQVLDVEDCTQFTMKCVKQLPKSLTDLRMKIYIDVNVTSLILKDIPPYLNYSLSRVYLTFGNG